MKIEIMTVEEMRAVPGVKEYFDNMFSSQELSIYEDFRTSAFTINDEMEEVLAGKTVFVDKIDENDPEGYPYCCEGFWVPHWCVKRIVEE